MCQFFIFGSDPRQLYLAEILAEKRLPFASSYETNPRWTYLSFEKAMETCPVILAPLPFTRNQKTIFKTPGDGLSILDFCSMLRPGQTLFGGSLPPVVTSFCRENQITFFDYMELEEVCIENAVATAEGAVCEAIRISPGTLQGSAGLLAGYGRCGRVLARKLKALDMKLTVMEKNPEKLALAKADGFSVIRPEALDALSSLHWQYLFNTVPAPLFGKEQLSRMPKSVTILDIASAPGGVDFDFCRSTGRCALLCPGLPGRFAPKAAAQVLADAVFRRVPISPSPKETTSAQTI
ncbi:MAG: dipicolinate synthase subunit DpsA [Lachnospiraceae bacterium]|nr:dipicolinate synthase subunit DpsA [Lachnospiraceae bacterium]